MGATTLVSRGHRIVDGYNLLHAHSEYAQLIRVDLDTARARLVSDLAGFAARGARTVVVFDGAGNPESDGTPHHIGRLTVIFSAAGVTADTVIERLAARFRERGEHVVVVTSDGATRETVASGSVSVVSSASFVRDLEADVERSRESGISGSRKVPVARRIDDRVSEVLSRWARGSAPQDPNP